MPQTAEHGVVLRPHRRHVPGPIVRVRRGRLAFQRRKVARSFEYRRLLEAAPSWPTIESNSDHPISLSRTPGAPGRRPRMRPRKRANSVKSFHLRTSSIREQRCQSQATGAAQGWPEVRHHATWSGKSEVGRNTAERGTVTGRRDLRLSAEFHGADRRENGQRRDRLRQLSVFRHASSASNSRSKWCGS